MGNGSVPGSGPEPSPKITLSPAFKLVVTIVTGLTILSLGVSIFLALYQQKSEQINQLLETCSTTYKLGFGALVGLIGGKAL
jgi:hypothetical protein